MSRPMISLALVNTGLMLEAMSQFLPKSARLFILVWKEVKWVVQVALYRQNPNLVQLSKQAVVVFLLGSTYSARTIVPAYLIFDTIFLRLKSLVR